MTNDTKWDEVYQRLAQEYAEMNTFRKSLTLPETREELLVQIRAHDAAIFGTPLDECDIEELQDIWKDLKWLNRKPIDVDVSET